MSFSRKKSRRATPILLCSFLIGLVPLSAAAYASLGQTPEPMSGRYSFDLVQPSPTPDHLEVKVLPENPTQLELAEYSYWYNCMPCHGDQGQGLTEAWRQTWSEDHRNCWDRGCHGGRIEDEGFFLPKTIPPVVGTERFSLLFSDPKTLYTYMVKTHPPQEPGRLSEEEYWALTAYLLIENGLMEEGEEIGPGTHGFNWKIAVLIASGILLVALFVFFFLRSRIRRSRFPSSGQTQ